MKEKIDIFDKKDRLECGNAQSLLDDYFRLTPYEQQRFNSKLSLFLMENKEEEYSNPQTTHEDIYALHRALVQTCIDFINKKGLKDIDSVQFNADSLQESAIFGSWQPCTDSGLRVEGIQRSVACDMDARKIIGYSM